MENLIEKSHAERGLGRAQLSEMGEEDHEPDRNLGPGHHRRKQAFGLASVELRIVPLGNRRHHQPAGNDAEERNRAATEQLDQRPVKHALPARSLRTQLVDVQSGPGMNVNDAADADHPGDRNAERKRSASGLPILASFQWPGGAKAWW